MKTHGRKTLEIRFERHGDLEITVCENHGNTHDLNEWSTDYETNPTKFYGYRLSNNSNQISQAEIDRYFM